MSEVIDDTGRFEPREVDHGHKKNWGTGGIGESKTQIVTHSESNRDFAAGALGFDVERKRFISQFPLHEGSRYRVCSSGGPEFFTAGERQPVWGRLGSNRVGPDDLSALRPEQKNKTALQLV